MYFKRKPNQKGIVEMTKPISPEKIQVKREKAFWDKTVPEPTSGCLLWIGAQRPNGYGKMLYKRKFWIAHRLAWFFTYRSLIQDTCVLHKCDNPLCVNPRHLFLGSRTDNYRDMENKGRIRRRPVYGEAHGRHKLSKEQVKEIRDSNFSRSILSENFGVCRQTIDNIKNHKHWKNI